MKVRVVYLDSGGGAFELKYDAADQPEKTAIKVQKTGSGQWKDATVELKDASFGNRCPHKTDLELSAVGGENTIFHMIEVTREQAIK